jgi:hypothetical protein
MRKRSAAAIPPTQVHEDTGAGERARDDVKETSESLNEELKKNAPRTRIEDAFEHRNRSGTPDPDSMLDDEIAGIVEMVFVEHPLDEYKKLEAALRIGDKRNDHGTVTKALDEAESNARLAHRLWMTARVERERWEKENAIVFAGMRDEASKVLEREKADGLRKKQITDADVEAMCAICFPQDWKAQELKRKRLEAMVKSMENLNECWASRCRTLQAMLTKMR